MTSSRNKRQENPRRGWFIALEGGEGAGKSTQAQMLLDRIRAERGQAILVHEPGTTTLGHHLREYLKSKQPIEPEAELLLFEASRAQMMAEIIRPSLEAGITVIADRFAASSIAYQGYGRNIGEQPVRDLNDFATGGLYPDLELLLDIQPGDGLGRTKPPQLTLDDAAGLGQPARQDAADTRRFEELPSRFHQRVRRGYQAMIKQDPEHWRVIDANMSLDAAHEAIWAAVSQLMEEQRTTPHRTRIHRHQGPVWIPSSMLFEEIGLFAADQVQPKPGQDKPPQGMIQITKAGAIRMIEAGTNLIAEPHGEALVLRSRPRE